MLSDNSNPEKVFLFEEKMFRSQLDFCVFDESTNFKIRDISINITVHLKIHFLSFRSNPAEVFRTYVANLQEKTHAEV